MPASAVASTPKFPGIDGRTATRYDILNSIQLGWPSRPASADSHAMQGIVQIQAPLPHIRSVNIWLLRGSPLTLIDTGPRSDEALDALEAGLRREGVRLEDIELVIPTH